MAVRCRSLFDAVTGQTVAKSRRLARQQPPEAPVGGGQRSRAGNRARRQMVLEGQVEIELAGRQVLEDGQYPAATAGGHEVIRILHAGGNAGQHARRTHSERREPER